MSDRIEVSNEAADMIRDHLRQQQAAKRQTQAALRALQAQMNVPDTHVYDPDAGAFVPRSDAESVVQSSDVREVPGDT